MGCLADDVLYKKGIELASTKPKNIRRWKKKWSFSDEVEEIIYKLNTPNELILENVKSSLKRGLKEVKPCYIQNDPIALVCGGPSLDETFPVLEEKVREGMKVVSVNGSHDWLLERGIRPSAHVQIDARAFNSRFVKNWQEKTKYLIASQCHPDVFDTLEGADVYLFHCLSTKEEHEYLESQGDFYEVPGGSTVATRAIPLLRMLGFTRIEVFGFDSCLMNGEHHVYIQEENNEAVLVNVTLGDREFVCDGWMLSQAKEFMSIVKNMGELFELVVHGDGLIAHILKTSAERIRNGS